MYKYIKQNYCFIIASAIMILPILIFASGSVPAADDFGNSWNMNIYIQKYNSNFIASLARVAFFYMNVGGYYYAGFINVFFSPFLHWGVTGIRVFNVAANLIFFCSLFFFVHTLSKKIMNVGSNVSWMIFFMFTAELINGYMNQEIYTWYTVVAAYVLPIATMFVGLSLFLYSFEKSKLFIPACICVFLASGSSLNVVALNCGLTLIIAVIGSCLHKFLSKRKCVIFFGASLAGGIIALVAPGNFERYGSSTFNIIGALKSTIVISLKEIERKTTQTPYLIILVLLLVVVMRSASFQNATLRYNHPCIALMVVIVGDIIVNYPGFLGTSASDLSGRGMFVNDIAFYSLSLLWTIYLGGWIKKELLVEFSYSSVFALLISCALAIAIVVGAHGGSNSFTTGYMIDALISDRFKENVEYEEKLLKEIMISDKADVVLTRSEEFNLNMFMPVDIRDDTEYWINHTVANYYDKNSVKLVIEKQ